MMLKALSGVLLVCLIVSATTGCEPLVKYQPIPAGLLVECRLPNPDPATNAALDEAFVIAYSCADKGNSDKREIKEKFRVIQE